MKNEKLLKALGQVDEAFVEEAAPDGRAKDQNETKTEKRAKPHTWVKWTALAACAALVIGIGAPRIFRAIKDDKRSFWPEGENYALAMTDDMVTALTTTDTTMLFQSGEDAGFPDWGLTLSVKNVTSTGLTLVCTKNGGNPTGELMCGTDYHLIVLEDGTWKDVPTVIENYAWNSLAYWIWEGQDTEFDYSWEWLYGKLPAGIYRLTKGFMDFRDAGDFDTAMYWVEFEITE